MIDKVQKIREEVERMHNLLPVMDGNNISINYADRICTTLEMYIDSLQDEPVSEELKEIAWDYADKRCHLDVAVFTPDEVKKERGKMQFTWQDLYDAVMFGAQWQKELEELVIKLKEK